MDRNLTAWELTGLIRRLKDADFGDAVKARSLAVRYHKDSCVPCMKKELNSILSYNRGSYAERKLQLMAASRT
mgnify:CR=1 FL=1